MRILISGICGHMGREVEKLCLAGYRGSEATAGVDINATDHEQTPSVRDFDIAEKNVDCIIDFSNHASIGKLLKFAVINKIPAVIATTGHTDKEISAITEAAKDIPVFFAANYSLGVALLIELAKKTATLMPEADIEIIEKHHNRKLDAPSGTALAIANAICTVRDSKLNNGRHGHAKRQKDEIGIHAVRMGNIVGEHEVIIGTESQTITLKHEAHTRALFAEGALVAAEFLCTQKKGLFGMSDLVEF